MFFENTNNRQAEAAPLSLKNGQGTVITKQATTSIQPQRRRSLSASSGRANAQKVQQQSLLIQL